MGRFVFALLTLSGFVVGLLAGGALGAYLAVSKAPQASPARFAAPMEDPSAGLNPPVPLPVRAQRAASK